MNNIGKLIERVAKHDKTAFEELYRAMRGKLVLQANRLLAGDLATAEDIVDEAFMDVWRRAGSFASKGSAEGWLCRIVRNKVIDHSRRSSRRKETMPLSAAQTLADSEDNPEQAVLAKDDRSRIAQTLKQLSGQQQEVLTLFYFLELSVQEIAKQINVPVGTVKSRLFHGRKKLHDCMALENA